MSDDEDTRCTLCGGPVGKDGRTLSSVPTLPPRAAPVVRAAPLQDADPFEHLTPGERFARAIERRNALTPDRRTSEQRGRRHTDQHP
jgi:hypothetical protein